MTVRHANWRGLVRKLGEVLKRLRNTCLVILSTKQVMKIGQNCFDKISEVVCLGLETTVAEFHAAGPSLVRKDFLTSAVLPYKRELAPSLSRVKGRPSGLTADKISGDWSDLKFPLRKTARILGKQAMYTMAKCWRMPVWYPGKESYCRHRQWRNLACRTLGPYSCNEFCLVKCKPHACEWIWPLNVLVKQRVLQNKDLMLMLTRTGAVILLGIVQLRAACWPTCSRFLNSGDFNERL